LTLTITVLCVAMVIILTVNVLCVLYVFNSAAVVLEVSGQGARDCSSFVGHASYALRLWSTDVRALATWSLAHCTLIAVEY